MRYPRKSAIAYMFRNFWHLAPVALVSAVLFGFVCGPDAEIAFVKSIINGVAPSENMLSSVLNTVTVLRFGQYWWLFLLAMVAFVLAESILAAKVSRHMRVGEMQLFPFKQALAVLPTMSLFMLAMLVLLEAMNLMVAGVAFLIRAAGAVAVVVVTAVLSYVVRVLSVLVIGTLLFAFPIMTVESYSFNSALSYSVRLMSERRKFLWTISLIYPLTRAALTVVCAFVDNHYVTLGVFVLLYLFCIMYVPSATFTLYYESVGGERRDISKMIF